MRGLTLKQPWADAVLYLGKQIENRTWKTSYRGSVLIHAGQRADRAAEEFVNRVAGTQPRADLVPSPNRTGAILGVAHLAGVHHADDCDSCSEWAMPGHYHWELVDADPFPEPIPAKGALGLWTPPAEVLAQLPFGGDS